jgi:hypothetical protein
VPFVEGPIGRVIHYLPEALWLLMFEADGSVLVHAVAGGEKPPNPTSD